MQSKCIFDSDRCFEIRSIRIIRVRDIEIRLYSLTDTDTIECEFYLNHSGKLRIVTVIEVDTTWQDVFLHIAVKTDNLWRHGETCTQEVLRHE